MSPRLLSALLLLAGSARAFVAPDVSAATPAGCRCISAAPTVATSGSFLAGTSYGCGPHPDPTGTFAYPAHWCLVDQTPALLLAVAGGSCGQKVAGLGNVSSCSGAAFSNVVVAPSAQLAAAQPATTFYLGQSITVSWTASGIVEPGEGAYVALVSATGVVSRIGGATFVNATAGSFTAPIAAAAVALVQPVTARVLQCKIASALSCTAIALPNATSTTVQPGIVGVSSSPLSILSLATVSEILDSRGISYTQPCVNFTSDNRTISITVLANLQLQGSLFIGLAANGGGTAGGPASSVTIAAPPANTPTVVQLGTGAAGGLSGAYTVNLRNGSTMTGALLFTSSALMFTKSGSLAGVPPTGGACAPSATPSNTMAPSITPTASMSFGASASVAASASVTGSISHTPTNTKTATVSPTVSVSPTSSPTKSAGSASPSPTKAAPSPSSSFKPSPSATSSVGAANLGAAGPGGGAADASSTSYGTIIAVVVGVCVIGAALGYAFVKRKGASNAGGSSGAGADASRSSGSARGFEAAPTVVVANNPLSSPGGRSGRAAFSPVGAGASPSAALSFIQCTDTARGVTYFANAATGETVWVLPPGGVVTQRMTK